MTIMKTANAKTDSQKLAGGVQKARLRVASAETLWQAAKQQARAAKRRRKEIKIIARRARQQAKAAKADLADARTALAEAEAKLAQSGKRVATRKPFQAKTTAKPVAKRAIAAPKRKAVRTRKATAVTIDPPPAPELEAEVTPPLAENQPRNES